MAVDSKQKRMSMLSINNPLAWSLHFAPTDSGLSIAEKKHILHRYAGLLVGDVPYVEPHAQRIVRHSGRYV